MKNKTAVIYGVALKEKEKNTVETLPSLGFSCTTVKTHIWCF